MALTYVGAYTVSTKAGSSVNVTWPALTAGDLCVIMVHGNDQNNNAIQVGAGTWGDTFTILLEQSAVGNYSDYAVAYLEVPAGGKANGTTTNVYWGSADQITAVGFVVRGGWGTPYMLGTISMSGLTSMTCPSSGPVSVPVGSLILGCAGKLSSNANTWTGDSDTTGGSWSTGVQWGTTGSGDVSNATGFYQYKTVTATSSQQWNVTFDTNTRDGAAGAVVIPEVITADLGPPSAYPTVVGAMHSSGTGGTRTMSTSYFDTYVPNWQEGDTCISTIVAVTSTTGTLSVSSGWSLIQSDITATRQYGIAVRTLPAAPSITWTSTNSVSQIASIEVFRGADISVVTGTEFANSATTTIDTAGYAFSTRKSFFYETWLGVTDAVAAAPTLSLPSAYTQVIKQAVDLSGQGAQSHWLMSGVIATDGGWLQPSAPGGSVSLTSSYRSYILSIAPSDPTPIPAATANMTMLATTKGPGQDVAAEFVGSATTSRTAVALPNATDTLSLSGIPWLPGDLAICLFSAIGASGFNLASTGGGFTQWVNASGGGEVQVGGYRILQSGDTSFSATYNAIGLTNSAAALVVYRRAALHDATYGGNWTGPWSTTSMDSRVSNDSSSLYIGLIAAIENSSSGTFDVSTNGSMTLRAKAVSADTVNRDAIVAIWEQPFPAGIGQTLNPTDPVLTGQANGWQNQREIKNVNAIDSSPVNYIANSYFVDLTGWSA